MKKIQYILVTCLLILTACEPEIPMLTSGLDSTYAVVRMRALRLHPEYSGERYEWSMPDSNGNDSIASTKSFYKKE